METPVIFLNRFFDVLWAPLSKVPNYVDIIIISAISALIFLIIFKKTSNQEMIRHYKNKIFAHILEIRLYKDQPILTIKIFLSILAQNLIYLRYTLVPLVVIFLPLLVISVQLNNRYGYFPLAIDNRFIIRADLDKTLVPDIGVAVDNIRCNTSKGILVETPPMRILSEASVFWRAKVTSSEGNQQFCRIAIDGTPCTVEKKIFTASAKQRFSPERRKWHLQSLFVSNAEGFISETSPFEALSVNYERATYPFLTWNTDPIVLYFILTLIFGFVLKPMIKVYI